MIHRSSPELSWCVREQLHLMHELGADEVQGYFFSRPLPASECEPFLLGRCDVARGGTAAITALA